MSGKKHKSKPKRNKRPPKPVPQMPQKSSWGAAIASFLQEYILNDGAGGFYYDYEDELSEEGKRKKDLIWGPLLTSTAVAMAILAIVQWGDVQEESMFMRIFSTGVVEAVAIVMGISGVRRIRNGIKKKKKTDHPDDEN